MPAKSSIGTTALALTTTPARCSEILIKASPNNSADVYIGNSTVTADGTDATDGLPLSAGEAVTIRGVDPSNVYARSTVAGQKVYWFAQ